NNLAITYEALGMLDKAREFQLKCLRLAEQSNYTLAQLSSFSNLGTYACKQGQLIDAIEHFAKAFDITKGSGLSDSIISKEIPAFYADYCQLQLEKGRYSQAYEVLQKLTTEMDRSRNGLVSLFASCELKLRLALSEDARELLERMSGPSIS